MTAPGTLTPGHFTYPWLLEEPIYNQIEPPGSYSSAAVTTIGLSLPRRLRVNEETSISARLMVNAAKGGSQGRGFERGGTLAAGRDGDAVPNDQ